MLRPFLQGLTGVELFGIVSMLIFLTFFITMVIHTFRMKKEEAAGFGRLPLEEDEQNINSNQELK